MRKSNHLRLRLTTLLVAAAVAALAAILFCPRSAPSPAYLTDARELAAGRAITSDFEKVGYPVLLWAGLSVSGMNGIYAAQALLYLGTVVLGATLLRRAGLRGPRFFWAGAIIVLHPYLLLNITRIVDTNLSACIFLGLVLVLFAGSGKNPGCAWATAAGLLGGYSWLTRPNYVLILGLFPLLVLRNRNLSLRKRTGLLAVLGGSGLLLVAGMTAGACGRVRLMTTDGGYTLFTGANPWTGQQLIRNYNTEGWTPRNLRRLGINPARADLDDVYLDLSLDYIRKNPASYLWFGVLKTVNLFRPDYRRVDVAAPGPRRTVLFLLQTILALPFPVWAAIRIRRGRAIAWRSPLRPGIIIFLYLAPFFFLSTDPRYRLPLDLLLVIDTARTLYLTRAGRQR